MSLLDSLKTDNNIANESDVLGGGGAVESGVYDATIKVAYIGKSTGGAMSLNLELNMGGRDVRQQLWVTSGDAKGNKNYYERDGKRNYLPGFNIANALSLLTVGKEISQLDTEDKVLKLWSYDAKAEVPTTVPVLTDLTGQEIRVGMIKQTVDKNVKNDAGAYVPSGETREENEIDKLFRSKDGLTVAEIRAETTSADFMDAWAKKWTGVTKNKAKGATGGSTAGAPKAAAAPKSTSLFS
jgi:hypothetical protein